jgi:hypothetical protein
MPTITWPVRFGHWSREGTASVVSIRGSPVATLLAVMVLTVRASLDDVPTLPARAVRVAFHSRDSRATIDAPFTTGIFRQ